MEECWIVQVKELQDKVVEECIMEEGDGARIMEGISTPKLEYQLLMEEFFFFIVAHLDKVEYH